jgi:hypothetical protein
MRDGVVIAAENVVVQRECGNAKAQADGVKVVGCIAHKFTLERCTTIASRRYSG